MAVFMDPEGAAFCVWQAKEHKGARIVNEPGSLNFNSLNTRDAEGAKTFYGSLFGWEIFGLGGGARMWTAVRATATSWSSAIPGFAQRMAETERAGGVRGRGRDAQSDRRRPTRGSGALERDVRGRRCRRDGREGRGAGRPSGRRRRSSPMGQDDRHHRSAGRDLHREQVRPGEPGTSARQPDSTITAR